MKDVKQLVHEYAEKVIEEKFRGRENYIPSLMWIALECNEFTAPYVGALLLIENEMAAAPAHKYGGDMFDPILLMIARQVKGIYRP